MGSQQQSSSSKKPPEPKDEVEQAIFDLQDVKNTYMNEQREFEEKAKSGFKTQEGFFQEHPSAQKNNFFGRPQTQGGASKLKNVQGDLINDPVNNLHGEMDSLSKEDLKERLIVAEKVMKSLFQRNKDLEDKFQAEQKTTAATSQFEERCSTCPGLQA